MNLFLAPKMVLDIKTVTLILGMSFGSINSLKRVVFDKVILGTH